MGREHRTQRQKQCAVCAQDALIMYRCRYEVDGDWKFVCNVCWPKVSNDNPAYQYGGTWKAKKR